MTVEILSMYKQYRKDLFVRNMKHLLILYGKLQSGNIINVPMNDIVNVGD